MRSRERQRGFGLIEIMVALVLGVILMGAVIQAFSSSRVGYRMEEGLSRLQENGRLAMDLVSFDARMGGFLGCANIDQVDPVERAGVTVTYGPGNAVQGHQHTTGTTWSPALPAVLSGLTSPPAAGTDVVTIRKGESCGAYLTGTMASATASVPIHAANTCSIGAGDVLVLADCSNADVFVSTNAPSGSTPTITHAATLSRAYGPEAEIMTFDAISYYVATGAGGGTSLWRLYQDEPTGGTNPEELVEGVENMQLLFGEDTDADRYADTYVAANAVADWANVVSVRMALLVSSVDNADLVTDTATYDLLGVTIDPPDNRLLKKVFRGTVSQRNKLP